jgi:hypothetical protein
VRVPKAEKRTPIPHDAVLAEQERQRRETLARDMSYQSGVQQALTQALENQKNIVQTRFGDVRKTAIKRDLNRQSRASYERTYGIMLKEVERLASMTGKPVSGVPAYYPPIDEVENTVTIDPPGADIGTYKEGGPRNGVLPVGVPGSAADWTNG